MRKFYSFILVFSLLVSIVFPGVVTEAKSKFKDVPEDFWAKAEIEFLS
ncbi:MAG: S-layer homology domain-containing protein, partial [Symbiobacterium thermophilum]|nr:S-layer homology domain-containing protein [Symbiobacterium thermophilum]